MVVQVVVVVAPQVVLDPLFVLQRLVLDLCKVQQVLVASVLVQQLAHLVLVVAVVASAFVVEVQALVLEAFVVAAAALVLAVPFVLVLHAHVVEQPFPFAVVDLSVLDLQRQAL